MTTTHFSIISPLASPEAPARLALPSRLAFSVISPLASPEAPARLALPSARIFGHFTARLAGGTGSARTTISARTAIGSHFRSFHRSPRRRHRLGSHCHLGSHGRRLAFSVISPLASPEAPARLALPSAGRQPHAGSPDVPDAERGP